MKGTENFKSIIANHLQSVADRDPLFAKSYSKESKNIDECINYILSEVQKSKCNGFADDEIFNMAIHYYDEDDIKNIKATTVRVVVNHSSETNQSNSVVEKQKEVPVRKLKQQVKIQPEVNIGKQVSLFDFPGV
ncbi:PcfK-like family protein [Flavobacterium agricola]|uniref:PcfK-like family protein n=1 Tax=Flavobacterium agricola TaxID=2870839 RepID=A0ABY6LZN2_9FLAO|nr:PcfK-like family protein [Flavobacterium agricola]UYW01774.1 PcfK-like family protein [Flavobacterium agricola]